MGQSEPNDKFLASVISVVQNEISQDGVLNFHCTGPISRKNRSFHEKSFINSYLPGHCFSNESFSISYEGDDSNSANKADIVFDEIRKIIVQATHINSRGQNSNSVSDVTGRSSVPTAPKLRNVACVLFKIIHSMIKWSCDYSTESIEALERNLYNLRLAVHKMFTLLPDYSLAFYSSTLGKDCSNPAFHSVHCHLDVRWIFMNIIMSLEDRRRGLCGMTQATAMQANLCFEEEVLLTMNELLWMSLVRYEKLQKSELAQTPAFACSCVKELWLLIVHAPYKTQDFWTYFIQTIRLVLDNKEPPIVVKCSEKIFVAEYFPCSNRNEFVIWFLAEIVRLQLYNSNGDFIGSSIDGVSHFELLDDIVKNLVCENEPPSEETMRSILPLLYKIHSIWNHTKSGPVITLWEYYNKRINSAFYIPGSKLNSIIVMSKSGLGLLEQVQGRLDGTNKDKHENSFLMWLRLLGEHLKVARASGASSLRLCSRVFIKFTASRTDRLLEMSEVGVFHLTSLYLTLAIGSHTPSTVIKLVELLSAVPRAEIKESKHDMIWKSYAASLLAIENMCGDVADCLPMIMGHLDWCVKNLSHSPVCHLIDALKTLFQKRTVKGSSIVIGPWIEAYIRIGSRTEGVRLLAAITPLLERMLVQNDGSYEFNATLSKLEQHVLPTLQSQRNATGAQLAALFTVLSARHRSQLLAAWTDGQDCTVTGKYLSTVLQLDSSLLRSQNLASLAVQSWIQWTLISGQTEDTKQYFQALCELDCIASLGIKWSSEDPLLSLINYFGEEYSNYLAVQDKCALRDLFLSFFQKFDVWLDNQFKVIDAVPLEMTCRVYQYSAFLFAKCPNIIYMKSRPKSILRSIVDSLLLPAQIRRNGFRIPRSMAMALSTNLEKFLDGLFSLDPEKDAYIARIIRDVISQYVTRLDEFDKHPLIACLTDGSKSANILKILSQFLKVKEAPPLCQNTLNLVQKAIQDIDIDSTASHIIFDQVHDVLIELMINLDDLHPFKGKILNFFARALTSGRNRRKLVASLIASCRKNMAFNSTQWFKTVIRLHPLCKGELQPLIQIAEEEVAEVEVKRGVDKDIQLRTHLLNLTKVVNS